MSANNPRANRHLDLFPHLNPLSQALEALAEADAEARGAIFTKPEVVGFILDLCGYSVAKPLYKLRLLEPSFGNGDFLLPAISRLLQAWPESPSTLDYAFLLKAVRAIEIHHKTYIDLREKVKQLLRQAGFNVQQAEELCTAWLIQGDFLLVELEGSFDFVVGNPPYIRQETIPGLLLAEYRKRYATVFDRADIYVPFIERGLEALGPKGKLSFICSDRWMKNRYGGPLRKLIANHFHLRTVVRMTEVSAFQSEVSAYPVIFVIDREVGESTRVATAPNLDVDQLHRLSESLTGTSRRRSGVQELTAVAQGDAPWLLESGDHLPVLRELERRYPTLEEAGCKVGIGVATGLDKVFIAPYGDMPVEECCKLPLIMTKDIESGQIHWRGKGVLNPFEEGGGLKNLSCYPRLARYLEERKDLLLQRHVARKNPQGWYRTIDRIHASLTTTPKLLIPDIKGEAHIVLDEGRYYPHHNLYFITSEQWNLLALQAVLLSSLTTSVVAAYSTRMRGGYLRFQAQYLRRIRLPHWQAVPDKLRERLRLAGVSRDRRHCDAAVCELYELNPQDLPFIGK